jgi:hypothetical protein
MPGSLVRTQAGKDDRKPVEPASKVGKEAQRRRVAPVEVVDREQDGRELDEVRSQPEEPVQRSVGSVLAAGRRFAGVLELEEWSSQVGRAVEEPCALVLAGCDQRRLEQLADDPVGEVALELTPASAQHLEPEGVRARARGAEQTCLADPRRSLEQHERPSPLAHVVEQLPDELELIFPLEQGDGPRVDHETGRSFRDRPHA